MYSLTLPLIAIRSCPDGPCLIELLPGTRLVPADAGEAGLIEVFNEEQTLFRVFFDDLVQRSVYADPLPG